MNEDFLSRFEALRRYVRERLATAPGCHDFSHTERVMRNAELLLEELPNADKMVVRLAALLHDIARPEELRVKGAVCHAEIGAQMADQLLLEYGFGQTELRQRVKNAVMRHRFRHGKVPETIEEAIIYDADKLDSLGAVGIGRAFYFAGREGAKLHNRADEALQSAAYSREDSAYREYLVKLRHLPQRMQTEAGRLLARERAVLMEQFFSALNREVFG